MDYQQQGIDFLTATHTIMIVGSPAYRKHFADDTTERYVFPVTFKRNGKQFTIQFGQSIAAGSAEPSAYDVLACLSSDYSLGCATFDEFCQECCYDEDSRKAAKIYKAICREYKQMVKLWGDCYEKLLEIA